MGTTHPPPKSRRRGTRRYLLLTLFAIPWLAVPIWLTVVSSFKTPGDASALSLGLPAEWNIVDNYHTVLEEGRYLLGLRNSLRVVVPTLLIVLVLGSMAGFGYARTRSVPLRVAYYLTTLSIVLPPAIIPTIYVLDKIGINGSRLGYILTMSGSRIGIIVFLVTGFVRGIPMDFEDAAQIDGASRWQIYRHVILPMIRPVMFTGSIILMISIWNDFFFALFLIHGTSNATLPINLYSFATAGVQGFNWNLVFAHVVLTSLPLLLVYVILQKRILTGLTEGGVTG